MAKAWYPILDYSLCTECGSCFKKCPHEVYKLDGERPVVIYPDGCVQDCHGYGNLCPVGAIEYVGDTSDWVAPGKQPCCDVKTCCCDSSGDV